jgi:hypothetical protein
MRKGIIAKRLERVFAFILISFEAVKPKSHRQHRLHAVECAALVFLVFAM